MRITRYSAGMLGLPDHIFDFFFKYQGWRKLATFIIIEMCIYQIIEKLAWSIVASKTLELSDFAIDHTLFAFHLIRCLPIVVQIIDVTVNVIKSSFARTPPILLPGPVSGPTQAEMVELMMKLQELEFSLYELEFPKHETEEESSDDVSTCAYSSY